VRGSDDPSGLIGEKEMPDFHSDRPRDELAGRLTELRKDLCGSDGAAQLAQRIGVPTRTWKSYEAGATMPAHVVLRLICLIGVEPLWLLQGTGHKYARSPSERFSRSNSIGPSSYLLPPGTGPGPMLESQGF